MKPTTLAVALIPAILVALAGGSRAAAAAGAGGGAPAPERFLAGGESLSHSVSALARRLDANPQDDPARFALGVGQVLRGVEKMAASFHRHGLRTDGLGEHVPFLRLPVPANPNPQPIGADELDQVLGAFLADLGTAQETFAKVDDPNVRLPLHVGLIRMDLDGDGNATEDEALWRLFQQVAGRAGRGVTRENAASFVVHLDAGDVHWFRGYCHLLSAVAEMMLAHDKRDLFERTGHLFFANVKSPHAYLAGGQRVFDFGGDVDLADAVAFVHLMHLPVRDPKRMESARRHLLATIEQSRLSWRAILKETDDSHEWIPGPAQSTVVPNMRVTRDVIDGWLAFLDQGEAVLEGKLLIPFWRGKGGQGVNLKRVFQEPRTFDLVLWVQGTAATPYLEQGDLATGDTFWRLQRMLGGDFFSFAIWVN